VKIPRATRLVHAYDQLRVGATLRHGDGEVLEILRRKANKNPLREPDDTTPIAPGRLERLLGGIDQETFENLFGINHARLKSAGEEIRTGQGRLGEMLFAAGTGLAGLGQAKQRLQERYEEIFKPKGQNPRINKALAELSETRDEMKRFQLSSDEWERHDRVLREAEDRASGLGEQIARCVVDRNRLERLRAAVPLAARRRALREQRRAFDGIVRLRADFGKDCRESQERLQLALRTIEQARGSLDSLAEQLEAIEPPRPLLDAAEEIEDLKERLGAVVKARKDRVGLVQFIADHEHLARNLLRDLGRPVDLAAAESFRLRADEPTIIRALAKEHAALSARRVEALKTIAKLQGQVEQYDRKRIDLGAPRAIEALRVAVQRGRKAGDLDDRLDQARVVSDRAEKASSRALARLPGWTRTLDDVECMAAPLDATLDRFETQIEAAEAALRTLDNKLAADSEEIGQLESKLQALDLERDVPTENDLRAARDRRDQGWKLVRSAWLDDDGLELPAFAAKRAELRQRVEAFEQAQTVADALADRLRRETDRVTRKTEWLSQIDRHRALREVRTRERETADASLVSLLDEWAAAVDPLGVPAATPAELRAWLRRRDEIVQHAIQARAARQALESLEQASTEHRNAIERALVEQGESPTDRNVRLADMLALAEDVLDREDKAARNREKLKSQAEEARADLGREQVALKADDDELDAWRARWAEMMERINLEPNALPDQAEVILDKIQKLVEAMNERRGFQARVAGMDRDAAQYAAQVGDLARRVAPDLVIQPAESQARELTRLLQVARAAHERHLALSNQRDIEQRRLLKAEDESETARIRLDRLCREAGCGSIDDLTEAERRSTELGRLEIAIEECEGQLFAQSGGADVDRFIEEVDRVDADRIGPEIERLDDEIEVLHNERKDADQTIGAERTELARMDGGDRAAEAAEKVQTISARLQADIALYAKLKLAATILNRGIEHYRDKSQGPVLTRASQLFADLTDGSFLRLQIDDDGDGRAVLKGARSNGRLVGVEGMSDGSHDQLYLALRLASLEAWLQAHEPIPFIVDDILLNFDDRRALAALQVLVGLSSLTQVLFFTHHGHLIELARANLPRDVIFVHNLPVARAE
jgi:uncharacterized protein YhaN